jgi:uncharacterized membrane protein
MRATLGGTLVALLLLVACEDPEPLVSYAEARALVDRHCVACHSARPTIPAFPIAPNGLELDTPEQMTKSAERIKLRTIVDKTMPLLNKTGMTDAERELLGKWIDAGARGP